jgi:hypothetical protein
MTLANEPLLGITLGWVPILVIWLPLCTWLLIKLGRRLSPGPVKLGALSILGVGLFSVPVADDAYIQWQFNRLCRDAGLHYEKAIEVDGYYSDIGPVGNDSFLMKGFQFVEYHDRVFRKKVRLERVGDKVTEIPIAQPTARYHFKFLYQHERIGHRLQTYQTAIVDSQTGQIVARSASYTRGPGWLDGLWLGAFDNPGRQCKKAPGRGYGDLLSTVLIPSKQH